MSLRQKILALETDGRAPKIEPFTMEAYRYNAGFQDARHAAAEAAAPYEALLGELVGALEWMLMLHRAHDEEYTDAFERVGDAFYKATGYLRPGKDCRMNSSEVRSAAWDKWISDGLSRSRAALQAAERMGVGTRAAAALAGE